MTVHRRSLKFFDFLPHFSPKFLFFCLSLYQHNTRRNDEKLAFPRALAVDELATRVCLVFCLGCLLAGLLAQELSSSSSRAPIGLLACEQQQHYVCAFLANIIFHVFVGFRYFSPVSLTYSVMKDAKK